ncbi:MAG: Ribose 5-phosphate isomerase B [Ignavibacteriae bacterium]|nr:MAG: Ribose 5-phosphate isomerase B [Ignavibacteriota bacterium]
MKVAIASDHAGYNMKEELKKYLNELGFDYKDFGTNSSESVDYPDYAVEVAKVISSKDFKYGILICGTGIGMSIAANKIMGVRAAVCESQESAKYSRLHNDANILCLGARIITIDKAKEITKIFLETEFEGGRHSKRIQKIHQLTGI